MLSWLPPFPGVRVPLIPCPPSWVGESHQSRASSDTSSAPGTPPEGSQNPAGAAGDLGHCQETSGVNSRRGSEAGRGRLPGDVGEAVVCGLPSATLFSASSGTCKVCLAHPGPRTARA